MSTNDTPGRREVAHRLFATEFDAADFEYADSDEERAPKYVIIPTGARVNRLFVVGVLTEVERINEETIRARIADPTGAFVVYAGQYQPDELAFFERTDPPAFVAITGKANAFQPEDSERVFTSIRPESVAEVDAETRDRWTVQAAAHTVRRIGEFARSLELVADEAADEDQDAIEAALTEAGIDRERASGIALAREHYGTTPAYLDALRGSAIEAARLVAGEVESVDPPGIAPDADDGREVSLSRLQTSIEAAPTETDIEDEPAVEHETEEPKAGTEPTTEEPTAAEIETEAEAEATAPEPEAVEPDAETAPGSGPETIGSDVLDPTTPDERSEGQTTEPTDDLGDFEPSAGEANEATEREPATEPELESESAGTSEPEAEPEGTDEDDFYELDEDERAEVEEEFGVDFSTGSEVGEPGEADIDVPDAEDLADLEAEADTETEAGSEVEPADVSTGAVADEPAAVEPDEGGEGSEPEPEPESEPEETDVNVEDAAMETMRELADGDGADRAAVIARVTEEHGVDADAVDDAIESALMSGRCYEPQDGVLKPI